MDKKKRALLASTGLMTFCDFNNPTIQETPDTRTISKLFTDGSCQIYDGVCCGRCAYRFGGSNEKFCDIHYKDEKCMRFKFDK